MQTISVHRETVNMSVFTLYMTALYSYTNHTKHCLVRSLWQLIQVPLQLLLAFHLNISVSIFFHRCLEVCSTSKTLFLRRHPSHQAHTSQPLPLSTFPLYQPLPYSVDTPHNFTTSLGRTFRREGTSPGLRLLGAWNSTMLQSRREWDQVQTVCWESCQSCLIST